MVGLILGAKIFAKIAVPLVPAAPGHGFKQGGKAAMVIFFMSCENVNAGPFSASAPK